MSTILAYGGYSHAADEVVLRSIEKSKAYGPRGYATEFVETWTFEGILQAATPAALTTAMAQLEEAYSRSGQNLIFYIDGTATRHFLLNSGSMGGPIVTSLSWLSQFSAEYTTFRSYSITVTARISQNEDELVEFREQLQSSGGLPDYRIHRLRNGPPIVQQVSPVTEYRAVQSGFAVGWSRYPSPPPPLFGSGSPPLKDAQIQRESPEVYRGARINFRVAWNYVFEAPYTLFGRFPTTR